MDREHSSKKKRLAVRILAGFFVAMLICTVLSRVASSLLVAQVNVVKVKKGRLSYCYEGQGKIMPLHENKIFLWSGQQIEKTANPGSVVKAGECLVQYRMEYLKNSVDKQQAETEQLRLRLEQQQVNARGNERVEVSASAALVLQSAWNCLQEARQEEADVQSTYDAIAADALNQNGAGEAVDVQTDSQVQEIKEQLYQELLSAQQQVKLAEDAVADAQNAYDIACQEDAAQAVNEANSRESAELGVRMLEVQLKQAEAVLKKLTEYQDAGGRIIAEKDCVVLQNTVTAGTITTGSEVLITGNGGWCLQGDVSDEDKEKITAGTTIEVSLPSGKLEVKVDSVSQESGGGSSQNQSGIQAGGSVESGEKAGISDTGILWYAPLPDNTEGAYNRTFTWKAEKESAEEYAQKIPLNALREEIDGIYCLIVSEESGMLGTVQTAKRAAVTVIEKDSKDAAVRVELNQKSKIIVSSEKYVKEGDQIRIMESEN